MESRRCALIRLSSSLFLSVMSSTQPWMTTGLPSVPRAASPFSYTCRTVPSGSMTRYSTSKGLPVSSVSRSLFCRSSRSSGWTRDRNASNLNSSSPGNPKILRVSAEQYALFEARSLFQLPVCPMRSASARIAMLSFRAFSAVLRSLISRMMVEMQSTSPPALR